MLFAVRIASVVFRRFLDFSLGGRGFSLSVNVARNDLGSEFVCERLFFGEGATSVVPYVLKLQSGFSR
jgi:hypothetical protein